MQEAQILLDSAKQIRAYQNSTKSSDNAYLGLVNKSLTQNIQLYETVSEIPYSLNYVDGCKYVSYPIHHGQHKLLISEMKFFRELFLVNPDLFKMKSRVIYVGSAPGDHIPTLIKLLPNINWILIDPGHTHDKVDRNFGKIRKKIRVVDSKIKPKDIRTSKMRAHIIPEYCTNELIENLSELENIIGIISDIRTSEMRGTESDTTDPKETDVIVNQIMQANWFKLLHNAQKARGERTAAIYFKFRFPYKNHFAIEDETYRAHIRVAAETSKRIFNFDWYAKYKTIDFTRFPYIKAKFYLQAYAPMKSPEIRGYVGYNDPIEIFEYNITRDFESKMNYHFSIGRQFAFLKNRETFDSLLTKKTIDDFYAVIDSGKKYANAMYKAIQKDVSLKKHISWYMVYLKLPKRNNISMDVLNAIISDYLDSNIRARK
jgi:hypothetical protein